MTRAHKSPLQDCEQNHELYVVLSMYRNIYHHHRSYFPVELIFIWIVTERIFSSPVVELEGRMDKGLIARSLDKDHLLRRDIGLG